MNSKISIPSDVKEISSRGASSKRGFLAHLRPRRYRAHRISFRYSFYLGFFTTFLLVVELITGLLLMFYYSPTPDTAYHSIRILESEIPFGQLLRDLHRLGGDLVLIAAFAHLAKVMFNGSCERRSSIAWMSGMLLFFILQALAFSGYLLPWDQRSFWAVTVGTSLFGHLPLIGESLQTALRGGAEIGASGLLRFYTLHVVILPLFCVPFMGAHYFRVVRHARQTNDQREDALKTVRAGVPLWPTVLRNELELCLWGLLLLIGICAFWYHAPLGIQANPEITPTHTLAPWFFLWVQGLLGGDQRILNGLLVPVVLGLLFLFLPWLFSLVAAKESPSRLLRHRILSGLLLIPLVVFLLWSSYKAMQPAMTGSAEEQLLDLLVTSESSSPTIPLDYGQLEVGVYDLASQQALSSGQLSVLRDNLQQALTAGEQQKLFSDSEWLLLVEQLQDRLKRVTLRLRLKLAGKTGHESYERALYLYDLAPPATTSEQKGREEVKEGQQ